MRGQGGKPVSSTSVGLADCPQVDILTSWYKSVNFASCTLTPKPYPETLNPQPSTLNPQPSTPDPTPSF